MMILIKASSVLSVAHLIPALDQIHVSTLDGNHHHGRAPDWSVAVSTSCLHRSLSWASRHAELSPWLNGWRSAFRVRSQVWRGRPGRRLQSLGSPRVDVWRDLKVSWESLIRATCPKKRMDGNGPEKRLLKRMNLNPTGTSTCLRLLCSSTRWRHTYSALSCAFSNSLLS